MNNQKKTLLGGLVAIFLGSSCCWMSTLAIWTGGGTLLTLIGVSLKSIEISLLILGAILIVMALYTYFKKYRSSQHTVK